MDIQRVRDAMEALVAANPEVADRDELAQHVRTVRELRTYLDAYELRCTRRGRELAAQGAAEPPVSLLAKHGGQSGKEAAVAAERERVAGQAGSFEDALGDAEVSAGHLDALALATKGLDESQLAMFLGYEADLLNAARTMSVDAFTRECRGVARQVVAASTDGAGDAAELDRQRAMANVKRWIDKSTGMRCTLLELDPVSDAVVWGAIDAQLATVRQADDNVRTPWQWMQVDAVIAAVGAGPALGSHRHPCTTAGRAGDAPHLRPSRLHRRCGGVPDPPREMVVARPRPNRHRQPPAVVRATSPSRPRGWLGSDDDPRPGCHLDPARRHDPPCRQHHRSGTRGSGGPVTGRLAFTIDASASPNTRRTTTAWSTSTAVLEGAGLVTKHPHGRERIVRGNPHAIHRAQMLLDRYEQIWRARIDRLDQLLADTDE